MKIYQFEGTVLVLVRIFVNKMHISVKKMNFSNIVQVKYSIVASIYIYIYNYFYLVGKFYTDIKPTNSHAK